MNCDDGSTCTVKTTDIARQGSMCLVMYLTLFAAVALVQPARAATFAVDDSASYVHDANTAMKWKSVAPSRRSGNLVQGATLVTVRLNIAPWTNKVGKIYMALPQQSIGLVSAAWTTQGRLLPGQVISGNRTLVYAGPIRGAIIEDTIALTLEADGQRLDAAQVGRSAVESRR